MSFFTRPDLDNKQFRQISGSTLTLSGETDFVGTLKSKGTEIDATVTGLSAQQGMALTLLPSGKIALSPSIGIYDGASPSTITVGHMPAATAINGRTYTSILQQILVAYLPPAFTSFTIGQSTPIEVGATLSGVKTFTWATSNSGNVQPNTIAIRYNNTPAYIATGLANDGTEAVNIGALSNTVPTTFSWRAEGLNTSGNTFLSSNATVASLYPYFWGKVASGGAPAGDNRPVVTGASQAQSLINSGTKVVASSTGTITITFNSTSDDYIWFAIPTASTPKTVWWVTALNNGAIGGAVSPGGNLFPTPVTFTINSPSALWSSVSYRIYISNYQTSVLLPMEMRNS